MQDRSGISEIAVQRSDENDDSQWGNGRAIKSIAGRVGRDVISFRPRGCPHYATTYEYWEWVTQDILRFMD